MIYILHLTDLYLCSSLTTCVNNFIIKKKTREACIVDYKKIADIALLAGKIMLESNAETYRVEETVEHILKLSLLEHTEAFVLPTGIMITLDDTSIKAISLIHRVKTRTTDLRKIHKVNDISRNLCANRLSIEDAYEQLTTLDEQEYSQLSIDIATLILAIGFTIMLGGNIYDSTVTLLNAIFLVLIFRVGRFLKSTTFFSNVIASIIAAIIGTIFVKQFPHHLSLDAIMVGSIMPMVPGTIITNAIRDTFHGDYLSGFARCAEAVIIALSIALGVAVGLILSGGGNLIS
ncbi:threonine/serine exporter [Granulicatella sp. zg-ZJ]|nr:threonine/serine exporter family protein [Granulicatella sp. zg-ZJ]NEW63297.1 threonine/serine exporter [Granulicatella sp. zg-ZJ]